MNKKLTIVELIDKKVQCELELQQAINTIIDKFQMETSLGISRIQLDAVNEEQAHFNKTKIENIVIDIDFTRQGLKL